MPECLVIQKVNENTADKPKAFEDTLLVSIAKNHLTTPVGRHKVLEELWLKTGIDDDDISLIAGALEEMPEESRKCPDARLCTLGEITLKLAEDLPRYGAQGFEAEDTLPLPLD